MKRRLETSFGANIPVVGRAEPPDPGCLPFLAEIFLMARGVEREAEGLPWFGQPPIVASQRLLLRWCRDDCQGCLGDVLGLLVDFHGREREIRRRVFSLESESG